MRMSRHCTKLFTPAGELLCGLEEVAAEVLKCRPQKAHFVAVAQSEDFKVAHVPCEDGDGGDGGSGDDERARLLVDPAEVEVVVAQTSHAHQSSTDQSCSTTTADDVAQRKQQMQTLIQEQLEQARAWGLQLLGIDRGSFSAVAATNLDALADSIVAAVRPQVAAGADMQNVEVEQIRSA